MPRGWSIDDLLADRQVHRQVQERIARGRPAVVDARRSAASSVGRARRAYSGCSAIQSAAIVSSGVSGAPLRRLRRASTKKRRTSSARARTWLRLSARPFKRRERAPTKRSSTRAGRARENRVIAHPGRPQAAAMNVTTEQLFDERPHPQRLHGRADLRQRAAPDLRPDEVGADLGQQHRRRGSSSSARPRPRRSCSNASRRGNVEKTRAAPVTAIIGMDMAFYDKLPFLFPHADAQVVVRRQEGVRRRDRVSQLEPAGRLLHHRGARARPRLRADERLRPRQDRRRVLGRHARSRPTSSATSASGDPGKVFARNPRLSFDEACRIE